MNGMMGIAFVVLGAILLLIFSFLRRRSPAMLRDIPALTRFQKAIGLSMEDGSLLHLSIGRGDILTPHNASAFAALGMARYLAERMSVSDKPPVITAGDPSLALLARDTLRAGFDAAGAGESYRSSMGRLSGLGPFGYAAGAMSIARDENAAATILIGHAGPEAALLIDSAERENSLTIMGSDDLSAQAIAYASAQEVLLGEETFASGAYLGAGITHSASLNAQDVLRWLVILGLLAGSALKLLGII